MIPAQFDYVAPASLDEALSALRSGGEDAKVLAGGHSLLPLMKLRLAAPSLLVDLRKVPGLAGIQRENGTVRIGAMTRHVDVVNGGLGLASLAASTIADPQVRNRGTIGGSLAHGDPASDLPAVMLALGAEMVIRGPGGERRVPASEFFTGVFQTAVAPEEILVEVHVPKLAHSAGWSYVKYSRRAQDWATVAVAAVVHRDNGNVAGAEIALTNMGATPVRAAAAEGALAEGASAADAAAKIADGTEPPSDTAASAEFRRHLAGVLGRRALEEALSR
jgi:aerobic carbon-monoxide dehydrogenase medium subunit